MPLAPAPVGRRPRFQPLTVVDVERLTDEAVAVTFALPDEPDQARPFLAFQPGQHLTLRATIGGEDVRQSYSLCLPRSRARATGTVRVASAKVRGGRMSTWLNDVVREGDVIDVLPPLGSFTCPTDPSACKHHVAVAAGSGITPVLALVAAVLEEEPGSRVTLFYGNRTRRTVMFADELAQLVGRYGDRLRLVEVFSREDLGDELLHGRIDRQRLPRLLARFAPVDGVDEWYLCGPNGLVEDARAFLAEVGVDHRIVHHEVFHVPAEPT